MAHGAGEYLANPVRRLDAMPPTMRLLVPALVVAGIVVFVLALMTDAPRAWRAYLFNWLFWISIAQGAVMLAAITTIARGLWARPVRRIALSTLPFVVLSYVLMIPLFFVAGDIFPWTHHDLHGKEIWLNLPFLAVRNLIGLGALTAVSVAFAYWALRPDVGLLRADAPARLRGLYERMSRGWRGQEAEERLAHRRLSVLGPVLALLYAFFFGLLSWDFVMSLHWEWWSTLIGPFFFMGAILGGVAVTAIMTVAYNRGLDLDGAIGVEQFHDLGKLTFAFSIFWAYLFWSQFIVIWYGMLPFEQVFVVHRLSEPFSQIAVLVFFFLFVLPFFGLLGATPKRTPPILALFATIVLIGLWFERYLLIYPSYYHDQPALPFGWPEIGMALPFAGLFIGSVLFFATRFPLFQLWEHASELELMGGSTEARHTIATEE